MANNWAELDFNQRRHIANEFTVRPSPLTAARASTSEESIFRLSLLKPKMKRAREGDHETKKDSVRSTKKADMITYIDKLDVDKELGFDIHADYFSYTPVGVFDFPWLKEGMIFKADDFPEYENTLAAAYNSNLDETTSTSGIEFPGEESLCQSSPSRLLNFQDDKSEDDLLTFQSDELDGADWIIWGSVLDQPLANGLN